MDRLRIISAKDKTGRNAFYQLELSSDKINEYQQDLANGKLMPLDYYGIIINSGYGDEFPADLKDSVIDYINSETSS